MLLFLRLSATRGYGEKLLEWMDAKGIGDRYWPLRSAFDAYLHGEAKLMDVNPEVRNVATTSYRWLAGSQNEKLDDKQIRTSKKPVRRKQHH